MSLHPRRRFLPWLLSGLVVAATASAGPIGGDFTLTGDDGRAFSLADAGGKLVLMTFGYAHCPDVCPTTLAMLARVMETLGEDADEVQSLFVTLDPARDSAVCLRGYLRHFHPRLLGLTGSAAAMDAVARQYGVRYAIHGGVAGPRPYVVDHGTDVLLLDRRGRPAAAAPLGTPTERIVELVRRQLRAPAETRAGAAVDR